MIGTEAADDRRWMRRALALARRGWGMTAPNPMVGAVLVRDGRVVGMGWHARYGGPHAEAAALAMAGEAARGATCYVTLEPCNHTGKTPPCSEALVRAGVARVVYALIDPNPVAAGGAARLREAGIETTAGVLSADARQLVAPFLFAARGATRPFITLKLALSLDGALADATRAPRWMTGARARRLVHRGRAQADAVAVGIGTVLADDPQLTVREGPAPRVPPMRVVFDRHLRLPMGSALVRTAREIPVIAVAGPDAPATAEAALSAAGVTVLRAGALAEGVSALKARGVQHLVCEGGAGLAGALIEGGMVDRLAIFRASVMLGAGALPAFGEARRLPGGVDAGWRVLSHRRLDDDLLTVYAPVA